MKSFLSSAVLALSLLTARLGAADEAIIAAVRTADDERVAATMAGARTRLEGIYSADLRYAHSSGKIDNKSEHVAGIVKRTTVYEKFDYQSREFTVVARGVVLMTGRVVIHSTGAKGPNQNDVNFLAVWREEQGRWRFLAWQAAKNSPAEPARK
jgi:hypothetical protein